MATLIVSFKWDDDDSDYDLLIEQLMALGAYDIEDQFADPEEPKVRRGSKKTTKNV